MTTRRVQRMAALLVETMGPGPRGGFHPGHRPPDSARMPGNQTNQASRHSIPVRAWRRSASAVCGGISSAGLDMEARDAVRILQHIEERIAILDKSIQAPLAPR